MSKSLLLSLGAGVSAFAAVTASAATLGTILDKDLGAATTVIAACDTNGITLDYTTVYDTSAGAYKVTEALLGGIANATCEGQSIKVTLFGASNAVVATGTALVGATPTATVTLTDGTLAGLASAVTGAAVVISGTTV
jgi:hypothetical protein